MKRSLDVAAVVLCSLLLIVFAASSIRGLVDPPQASVRFGMPVTDASAAFFYRVYLSRNLVIVALGAIFLLSQQWKPLAVLLTVTAALPLFDISLLWLNGTPPPVFHPVSLALVGITAALLWRRVVTGRI
jgi:hypothetical protein